MTDLNTTKLEILEGEGERSEQKDEGEVGEEHVSKIVDDTRRKGEDFPCGLCENKFRTKAAKELHMKRKHNHKSIQYTPSPRKRKIGYTWFSCKSCKVKNAPKMNSKSTTTTFICL